MKYHLGLIFCEQREEKPEKTFSDTFNLRIDPDLHAKLSIKAKAADMSLFYTSYARVQQAVGFSKVPLDYCLNIPWGHNVILLNKAKKLIERKWCAKRAIEHGCSRSIL